MDWILGKGGVYISRIEYNRWALTIAKGTDIALKDVPMIF